MKKRILKNLLYYSGVVWLYSILKKFLGKRSVTILCYHRVCNVEEVNFLNEDLVSATPANFDRQMRFVARFFNVIDFDTLFLHYGKGTLPRNAVIITFDDGYKDNYINAYPILKKYKLPATIFLTTDHVNKGSLFWWDKVALLIKMAKGQEISLDMNGKIRRFMLNGQQKRTNAIVELCELLKGVEGSMRSRLLERLRQELGIGLHDTYHQNVILNWEEINEMHRERIDFGGHTMTHVILSNVPPDVMKTEVENCKKEIEDRLGQPAVAFVFPNGGFDSRSKKALKEAGFQCACTMERGVNDLSSDLFELKRIPVNIEMDEVFFRTYMVFPALMSRTFNLYHMKKTIPDKTAKAE